MCGFPFHKLRKTNITLIHEILDKAFLDLGANNASPMVRIFALLHVFLVGEGGGAFRFWKSNQKIVFKFLIYLLEILLFRFGFSFFPNRRFIAVLQ